MPRTRNLLHEQDIGSQRVPATAAKDVPRPKNAVHIQTLAIEPSQQCRILLGKFTAENPTKGFLVELEPDPEPPDSVVTTVTSLGSPNRYALSLYVANFSERLVYVGVWRL